MNRLFKLISLILILTLNISCVEQKSNKKELCSTELQSTSKTDTLKFTTGIHSIFQDSKGNYWLGSHQEGVSRFNGESFEYFTIKEGLSDNQIRSIQEDKNGIIWFETANGVNSFDGTKITNHTPTIDVNSQNKWVKADNDLWFGAGNNAGVYRYNGIKMSYLAFQNPKIINPKNVYHVTGIAEGKNDLLWIGTYAGVFGYNGKTFTVINDETLKLNIAKSPIHIRSILEDSKGRLWIGNNGIGVILKDNDTVINFSELQNLIHPTSTRRGDKSKAGTLEHVFAIEEDAEGNIWFGDRDTGAWKYDGNTMTNFTIDAELKSQMIWEIYEDTYGNLLFAMEKGGVYKFNGNSFDKMF